MSLLRAAQASCSFVRSLVLRKRKSLALAIALAAGLAGSTSWLLAQQPLAPVADEATHAEDHPLDVEPVELTTLQEPVDEEVESPALPELPETIVPGRASFPAAPLDDDTTITATRTPTVVGRTGASMTVITAEDIAQREQTSVAEVLRGRVGLDVVRSGGPGGQTSVFLRGANSQGTKVILDGIWINDPSNATRGFDFSTLDVENIERIEVLRGPQSLLYGSDAIGGVVNITTKRGEGPAKAIVTGQGGSFGTHRIGANVSGGDEFKYYSLGGSYFGTDGVSTASVNNGNTERDGFKLGTLSGRFGVTASDEVNVDYVFRYTDSDAETDDFEFFSGVPIDNLIRKNLLNSFYNRVQMQSLFLDGGIEQIIGFSLTDYHRKDTDSGPFIPPVYDGQTRLVDWQMNFLLTDTNTFTAGAQYYAEEASSTFDPLATQNTGSFFLQDQWQILENWYASVGVRWDDNSRAGPAETYRATTMYTITPTNTDVHSSIGTGFRAPALAENLFAFGNPNLLPERSKGWDIGATQRLLDDRFSIDATYFRNDFQDLIVFDFNTFALANIGQSRASGVELTSSWQVVENTRVYANYTMTDTIDLATGLPLLRRPKDKATVGIDQYFWDRKARVGAYMLYVGQRYDTNNFVLAPYTVLNLNSSYYFNPSTELFARIDNVSNKDYEEVRGYGVPGIAGYAGMSFTW